MEEEYSAFLFIWFRVIIDQSSFRILAPRKNLNSYKDMNGVFVALPLINSSVVITLMLTGMSNKSRETR